MIIENAMVRSYIRIYGPPVQEAIDALEGVAVEMSKITSIKFSHGAIPLPGASPIQEDGLGNLP